ncbi:4-carboxymuconolactone decarboxylase [Actinospica robiniae]|uniref:bifunctional 3-oxoadipate enol-lactonase/4-carboxymuconolactone decarboxylase PcaDC n=1 Tax=Actinospica robiniae TaxID=304901 RepID=UPI0004017ACC|nr:4-carboxymuconolactone decarboxylase [Actinospica robiniae]
MSDSLTGARVLHHVLDGPAVPASAGADAPVPLLLGPSIGTTTALWAQVVPALARDRRVVRWDLPGHGRSSRDLIPASIADLGQLVVELADSLGIERFDYAGDSLGGAVGTWLAAHHPDRVHALAVLCSSAHFGDPANWRARAERVRAGRRDAMAELADSARDRWFPADAPIRGSEIARDLIAAHAEVDPLAYAGCCDVIAGLDLTGELSRIAAPTLVIGGRLDPATPPAHARELADGIKNSTLLELAGVGHLAPVEAPERVAAALAEHVTATTSDDARRHAAGMKVRRAVLGDAHVDRAVANTTAFTAPFQDLITRYAWGEIWTRPGLDRRTRSCITLTALVAHGHLDELAMHVRAARNNGLTPDEIGEVLLQSAVYCGVPAANSAFAVARRVLEAQDEQ